MTTETWKADGGTGTEQAVRKAAAVLQEGGLVVFPTETVYGLAANAADPKAMQRLREVKNRPADKPFTVHIARKDRLHQYVPELSRTGAQLVRKGWPGPLTLIFSVTGPHDAPVAEQVSPEAMAGIYRNGTIGLRCPNAPVATALLDLLDVPIVAASANPAGQAPAVNAVEAMAYLDGEIDVVLDAGRCRYAKASTIVRVEGDRADIVREGVYDERMVRKMLTTNIVFVCTGNTCRSPMAEGICRKLLAERIGCKPDELEDRGIVVSSAGTYGMTGSPASAEAVEACAAMDIDISRHQAQVLTPELLNGADYVFTMTGRHLDAVNQLMPTAQGKAELLDPQGDIDDPIGAETAVYVDLANQMEAHLRQRLEDLEL